VQAESKTQRTIVSQNATRDDASGRSERSLARYTTPADVRTQRTICSTPADATGGRSYPELVPVPPPVTVSRAGRPAVAVAVSALFRCGTVGVAVCGGSVDHTVRERLQNLQA